MMAQSRVIGAEHIQDAYQRGRIVFEVLSGDIVTDLAVETAERLGIRLSDGPLDKPAIVKTDGAKAMVRGLYRRSSRWVSPHKAVPRQVRRFSKLALVGAGGVGGNIAHLAAMQNMADEIMLIDIVPGMAAATAMDLNHASGITGASARCFGSENLADLAGADVIVVTAGMARRPGMTRADLIDVNKRIIHSTAEVIRARAPEAIVIVVTNPLDEMTLEMFKMTQFPRERVLGMAGTLDSSRFRNALAGAAGVSPADVDAITLGSHGDEMTPIPSLARIKGRPLERYLTEEQIEACVKDAVTGGGQVVALKKSGSATIAPAHGVVELLDHIRGARVGPVPVSVMMAGEYGVHDVVLGVPAHLGKTGLIEVEELRLSERELQNLHAAAEAVRKRLEH